MMFATMCCLIRWMSQKKPFYILLQSKLARKQITFADVTDNSLLEQWVKEDDGRATIMAVQQRYELLAIAPADKLQVRNSGDVATKDGPSANMGLVVGSGDVRARGAGMDQKNRPYLDITLLAGVAHDDVTETAAQQNLEQAALALHIHWYHQTRIQKFTADRERKIKEVCALKEKNDSGKLKILYLEEGTAVGMLIGKAGKNIMKLQEQYGVEIKVSERGIFADLNGPN